MPDHETPPPIKCPNCGMYAIAWPLGWIKTCSPPLYPYQHRCACGFQSHVFDVRGMTEEQQFDRAWRAANGK